MKGKYTVYLNAYAHASYTVEAESAEAAYNIVMDENASLSDVEASDWAYDEPVEVRLPTGEYVVINE